MVPQAIGQDAVNRRSDVPDALDGARPNRFLLASGMGKSFQNELLAKRYLRAAGVAAVWIDADGHVGAQDVAKIEVEAGHTVYCCARGAHFVLFYRPQLKLAQIAGVCRLLESLIHLNRTFKEARVTDSSVRYVDYLNARKAAMLEAIASEAI